MPAENMSPSKEDQFSFMNVQGGRFSTRTWKNLNIIHRAWYLEKQLICVQWMEIGQGVEMRL